MTPLAKNTIWFAVEDSQILERVLILDTVVFPNHGKFILYKLIDWPDAPSPGPFCTAEKTFRQLYTPQETLSSQPPEEAECLPPPSENFSSKTFWHRLRSWFSARQKPSQGEPPLSNNSW